MNTKFRELISELKDNREKKKNIQDISTADTPDIDGDWQEELKALEEIETGLNYYRIKRPETEDYINRISKIGLKYPDLRKKVITKLIESTDISNIKRENVEQREAICKKIEEEVKKIIKFENLAKPTPEDYKLLLMIIEDEILRLGPLEQLIRDESVTEIMVNSVNKIFIERKGKLIETSLRFDDEGHLRTIIDRILAPLGRRLDESTPLVDARLADGSRVNITIPPITLDGPTITIRKFPYNPLGVEDLIKNNSINELISYFLEVCVLARLNIIISGGTGSGKTTLLNIMSNFIPEDQRIIVIEDTAELQIHKHKSNVVRMETRPANVEGKGEITIRALVKNSLRMRPDRLVIGEVRGGEVLDMIQAMNTGHDGSLSTAHANTPRELMYRLETMALMANLELPVEAIRKQIGMALDLVIQTRRLSDGSRKITAITEITVDPETSQFTCSDIFVFKEKGLDPEDKVLGEFIPTGYIPSFLTKLKNIGIEIPEDIFQNPDF